jgi:hypothetical protein
MTALFNLIEAHPTISVLIAYYLLSAAIGAMPAPTASDGRGYQFFFKFFNTIGGNLTRAFNTYVEGSPNFQPAVNLQQEMAGQQQTTVKVPPTVEDKSGK